MLGREGLLSASHAHVFLLFTIGRKGGYLRCCKAAPVKTKTVSAGGNMQHATAVQPLARGQIVSQNQQLDPNDPLVQLGFYCSLKTLPAFYVPGVVDSLLSYASQYPLPPLLAAATAALGALITHHNTAILQAAHDSMAAAIACGGSSTELSRNGSIAVTASSVVYYLVQHLNFSLINHDLEIAGAAATALHRFLGSGNPCLAQALQQSQGLVQSVSSRLLYLLQGLLYSASPAAVEMAVAAACSLAALDTLEQQQASQPVRNQSFLLASVRLLAALLQRCLCSMPCDGTSPGGHDAAAVKVIALLHQLHSSGHWELAYQVTASGVVETLQAYLSCLPGSTYPSTEVALAAAETLRSICSDRSAAAAIAQEQSPLWKVGGLLNTPQGSREAAAAELEAAAATQPQLVCLAPQLEVHQQQQQQQQQAQQLQSTTQALDVTTLAVTAPAEAEASPLPAPATAGSPTATMPSAVAPQPSVAPKTYDLRSMAAESPGAAVTAMAAVALITYDTTPMAAWSAEAAVPEGTAVGRAVATAPEQTNEQQQQQQQQQQQLQRRRQQQDINQRQCLLEDQLGCGSRALEAPGAAAVIGGDLLAHSTAAARPSLGGSLSDSSRSDSCLHLQRELSPVYWAPEPPLAAGVSVAPRNAQHQQQAAATAAAAAAFAAAGDCVEHPAEVAGGGRSSHSDKCQHLQQDPLNLVGRAAEATGAAATAAAGSQGQRTEAVGGGRSSNGSESSSRCMQQDQPSPVACVMVLQPVDVAAAASASAGGFESHPAAVTGGGRSHRGSDNSRHQQQNRPSPVARPSHRAPELPMRALISAASSAAAAAAWQVPAAAAGGTGVSEKAPTAAAGGASSTNQQLDQLGPVARALVEQHLGPNAAMPSSRQLQYCYWQLADEPFSMPELQRLVGFFLAPYEFSQGVGTTRNGRSFRKRKVQEGRVGLHYPWLYPCMHELHQQVQKAGLLGDSSTAGKARKRRRSSAAAAAAAPVSGAGPIPQALAAASAKLPAAAEDPAVVMLRLLRCLELWEARGREEPHMLLCAAGMQIPGVRRAAKGAEAGGDADQDDDVMVVQPLVEESPLTAEEEQQLLDEAGLVVQRVVHGRHQPTFHHEDGKASPSVQVKKEPPQQ